MRLLELFGIPFIAEPRSEILKTVSELSELSRATSVTFINAHVVVESHRNAGLKSLLKKATINVPDGKPVAWLLNAKGEKQAARVSGPDLMLDLLKAKPQHRHFLIGSTPLVLEKLKSRFPDQIVGQYAPPFMANFSDEEINRQLTQIEESKADYIWVGLGAPKQEKYVVEMSQRASRGVWLAVGAAFDFLAGQKPRAPQWMQNAGLEWAYRFASEPKRLGPRYLSTNPEFLYLATRELFLSR